MRLFALDDDHAYVRHDASPTSELAAARAAVRSSTKRRAVLRAIVTDAGGLTDSEVSSLTAIPPNTARPRRVELVNLGLVEASGHTRENNYGNLEAVWVATPAGREAMS
jgi:predicted ArsR family transcriptional regulator